MRGGLVGFSLRKKFMSSLQGWARLDEWREGARIDLERVESLEGQVMKERLKRSSLLIYLCYHFY